MITTSCSSSENIKVPTTAAALLRKTVESSSAKLEIARIGIRYTARLPATSSSPRSGVSNVPESVGIGLKPETMMPATVATTPLRMIARIE